MRFTFYLKDGRTASVSGSKLDPNVDRLFQGQIRNFVIVTDGTTEMAVFLSTDVIGWTVEDASVTPPSSNGVRADTARAAVATGPDLSFLDG